MTPEQVQATAALILIRRLVRNHELTVEEAVTAVARQQRQEIGPHTHLVVQEATAVISEVAGPLRALAAAMLPAVRDAAAAMAKLLAPFRTSPAAAATKGRKDRPAWVSPYGPPPRR
ncbi:hypothetical protein ACFY7V_03735 [[Kitasatospora] papulosa]|uniref:hypothetical protein n=1 Tax=Streptomyces TaxID=1883 RepID=UPI002FF3A012